MLKILSRRSTQNFKILIENSGRSKIVDLTLNRMDWPTKFGQVSNGEQFYRYFVYKTSLEPSLIRFCSMLMETTLIRFFIVKSWWNENMALYGRGVGSRLAEWAPSFRQTKHLCHWILDNSLLLKYFLWFYQFRLMHNVIRQGELKLFRSFRIRKYFHFVIFTSKQL